MLAALHLLLRILRDPAWKGIGTLISIIRLLYRMVKARASLPGVSVANRRRRKNVLPGSYLQRLIVTLSQKKETDNTLYYIILSSTQGPLASSLMRV